MLTKEIMGVLALAIVWVNTLLIAASAFKDIASLLHRMASLVPWKAGRKGPALIYGRIEKGQGTGESIASQRIEQIGRSSADPNKKTIIFSDRSFTSTIFGGVFVPDKDAERPIQIGPLESGAQVWLPKSQLEQKAACPSAEHFDHAYEEARKAKGHLRTVEARIFAGQHVWIAGEMEAHENTLKLRPSKTYGLLISKLHPRRELRRRIALSLLTIILIFAAASGATALALSKPYFGTWSTVGGGLCLLYFLLVQPAGTALRNHIRLPHLAYLRGNWVRETLS